MEPKLRSLLAIIITFSIAVGSLLPQDKINPNIVTLSDKVIHIIAYFVLTYAWLYVFDFTLKKNHKTGLILTIFFYGIIIEAIQYIMTDSRQADIFDVVANVIGILLALGVVEVSKKLKTRTNY